MQSIDTNIAGMAVWLWLCDGEGEGSGARGCVWAGAPEKTPKRQTKNGKQQTTNDERRRQTVLVSFICGVVGGVRCAVLTQQRRRTNERRCDCEESEGAMRIEEAVGDDRSTKMLTTAAEIMRRRTSHAALRSNEVDVVTGFAS